ncbi:MAG: hypothetical protein A3J74_03490 [Elusimicrobia bacterium RIFCSPHIGHO2_02_FULL_57_9]|nr:MAG: hypothetical protein A3J74_03490 [Elusimicrobia bacterium RIFCSPHIGHO2_02_FULL_57_9]
MENTLTITQARSKFLHIPDKLGRGAIPQSLTVTRHGKPVLAIVPWELYESIMETLEIMANPQLMKALRASIKEASSGKTIPWNKVKRRLGL